MIKVNFTDGVEVMTSSTHLYQWDSNQEITISGLDVVNASVHFTNKKRNDAIVVNGTRNNNGLVADIPNILLEDDLDIIAYVHVVASNKGNTIKVVKIPKIARQRPSDYQFTENVEIMTFERLQTDFNNLADECHDVLDEIQRELMTVDGEGAINDGGYSIIKPRRATTDEWENADSILAEGEIAVEVPTGGVGSGISKLKIGDGTTPWNELPYAVDNLQGAIDEVKSAVGFTKKNLIPYPYYNTSRTQNDTDWVDSGDGSISVSGTPSADNMFVIISRNSSPITLKAGTYILSGCPSGGSEETYRLYVTRKIPNGGVDDSEFIAIDYGEGCKFTIEEDSVIGIACQVKSGVILQDVVIKPMLRYASIEDDTYESYVADVNTLLKNIETINVAKSITFVAGESAELYNYVAPRKCVVNLTCMATYSTGNPKMLRGYACGIHVSQQSYTSSYAQTITVPVCAVLEKGENVVFYGSYHQAGANTIRVYGTVQCLE